MGSRKNDGSDNVRSFLPRTVLEVFLDWNLPTRGTQKELLGSGSELVGLAGAGVAGVAEVLELLGRV